jgi:photosystem II stability/assembly factor-like uncharacterized protein
MKNANRRPVSFTMLLALTVTLAIQTNLVVAADGDKTEGSSNENWENVSEAFTKQIAANDVDPTFLRRCIGLIVTPDGDIVIQTSTKGICFSRDQGATWSVVPDNNIKGRCESASCVSIDYPYTGRMAFFCYDGASGMSGGMSLDGAKTWCPFSQLHRGVTVADVDWNSEDPQIIFGMTHEPFYTVLSDDGGETWQQLYKEETGSSADLNYCQGVIDGKTLTRYNPNKQPGVIELSTDAGQTWTTVTADYKVLGRRPVHYGRNLYWTTAQGVIKSTNGKDWTLTGPGAEGSFHGPYFGLSEQEFVVVTDTQFLKTEDGGKTWKPIAKFYKAPDITHDSTTYSYFGWDAKHNILYASGLGCAVYKLQLSSPTMLQPEPKPLANQNATVTAPVTGPSLGMALDPASPQAKLLGELKLPAVICPDVLSAMSQGDHPVVVAAATLVTLKTLNSHSDAVKAFTANGGWLMLWGLTPEGLADFNQLVGVEHLLRPFTVEAAELPAQPDPLLNGLHPGNVTMLSGEGAQNLRLRAGDVWSYVLDGDDIAPFAKIPSSDYWRPGEVTKPGDDHYPPNLVNGLDDSWQLGFTIPITKPEYLKWNFDFPRPETVTQFSLIPDTAYNKIQRIRLTFPGSKAQPLEFAVQPMMTRQDFPVPNIQATGMTLELITETQGKVPVTGIRNLWIKVQRSDDFKQKVQPLLSIGVLNKYPMGKGGILLNEMQPKDGDLFIHNQQKRILSVLINNLLAKPESR